MFSYQNKICSNIFQPLSQILLKNSQRVRLALIEFTSHNDNAPIKVHPFTSNAEKFQNSFQNLNASDESCSESRAIETALTESLTLEWRTVDPNDVFHEKFIILVTDGPPCDFPPAYCHCVHNNDLWQLADKLEKEKFTLSIIGIEKSVNVCADFYCALAKKTGGAYFPLVNAKGILSNVIQRPLSEDITLSNAFSWFYKEWEELKTNHNYSSNKQRIENMIKKCRNMSHIHMEYYNYFVSSSQSQHFYNRSIECSDQFNVESPTSPINILESNGFFHSNYEGLTPVTDDEGYRTRLSTIPSPNPSMLNIINSPRLSHDTGFDPFSDEDDFF